MIEFLSLDIIFNLLLIFSNFVINKVLITLAVVPAHPAWKQTELPSIFKFRGLKQRAYAGKIESHHKDELKN